MNYLDRERQNLMRNYPTFEAFNRNFKTEGAFAEEFEQFAENAGIKRNRIRIATANTFLNRMVAEMRSDTTRSESETYHDYIERVLWSEDRMRDFLMNLANTEDANQLRLQESSDEFILLQLKALLARNLFGNRYFFQTIRSIDPGYQRALKVVEDENLFRQLKVSQ
jgi:hypothetical protein